MSVINNEEKVAILVQQNHNLIYSFAHSHYLDLEEYYDLLAISLVNAARVFQEDRGIQFSTLCYKIMENDWKQHLRKVEKDLFYRCDSLDNNVKHSDERIKYIDTIGVDDRSDLKLILTSESFLKTLSKEERYILLAKLENKTQQEIAHALNLTQTTISRILYNLRQKISNIL